MNSALIARARRLSAVALTGMLAVSLASCTSAGSVGAINSDGSINADACPAEAKKTFDGDTIKLGASGPLSGAAASSGDALLATKAYFDHVNASGGIDTVAGKKKVDYVVLDDAYEPSRTQQNVRRLIERDKVHFIAGLVGSAPALSVAPYMNANCIPSLWPAAGPAQLAKPESPFTTSVVSYRDEGRAIGRHIAEKYPDATIAALYQNDDAGKDMLEGMREGLEGSQAKVVEDVSYETTDTNVESQMTTLAASKAEIFLNASITTRCTQALASIAATSWRPVTFVGDICNESGIALAPPEVAGNVYYTKYFVNAPGAGSGIDLYENVIEQAGLEIRTTTQVGFNNAQLIAATIAQADELTRIGIARAATEQPEAELADSILLDGVKFAPAQGKSAITQFRVVQWQPGKKRFAEDGPLVDGSLEPTR